MHIDPVITVGSLIHLVVLIGTILGVWMRIEKKMTMVETQINNHEKLLFEIQRDVKELMHEGRKR